VSFPRCSVRHPDGRQCWLKPDHFGKHLILPRDRVAAALKGRVLTKRRPDVPSRVLSETIVNETIANFR